MYTKNKFRKLLLLPSLGEGTVSDSCIRMSYSQVAGPSLARRLVTVLGHCELSFLKAPYYFSTEMSILSLFVLHVTPIL